MMDTLMFSQFEILRARVEASVERPGAIMVTSAVPGDGKSLTAYGLAERLSAAGRRVALIDFAGLRVSHDRLRDEARPARSFPVLSLGDETLPSAPSPEQIKQFVRDARKWFEYVVIDAKPLLESRTAIVLAGSVDGVLVSVRHGRASGAADVSLVQALERGGARMIGVVAAMRNDIGNYERPLASYHVGDALITMMELQKDRGDVDADTAVPNLSNRVESYA